MSIEKILNVERAKRDMTIDEMCQQIGVTRNVYYNWLNKNFENISGKYIIRLAQLFNCSANYLLGLDSPGEHTP